MRQNTVHQNCRKNQEYILDPKTGQKRRNTAYQESKKSSSQLSSTDLRALVHGDYRSDELSSFDFWEPNVNAPVPQQAAQGRLVEILNKLVETPEQTSADMQHSLDRSTTHVSYQLSNLRYFGLAEKNEYGEWSLTYHGENLINATKEDQAEIWKTVVGGSYVAMTETARRDGEYSDTVVQSQLEAIRRLMKKVGLDPKDIPADLKERCADVVIIEREKKKEQAIRESCPDCNTEKSASGACFC